MNKKITLFKGINLINFCALMLLFLIPFFIFIGKKNIAIIFADFAYGFLILSLILVISEKIKSKIIIEKRVKIFNSLLFLLIFLLFFTPLVQSVYKIYKLNVQNKIISDASIYLEKGKSFLDNAEYDDAIKELEKAIEIDDRNFKSYYLIGRAFYKKGDYENAKNHLLKAVGIKGDDFSSNILLSVVFENLGDYDKAIVQYKIAKDLRSGDFGVHYGLGRTFYKMGKIYKALDELLIADKKNSGNFEVNFVLGKINYERGDYENSLRYFRICESIDPENRKVQDYLNYWKEYENGAYLIKFFGVAMTFFALSNILILYNLSIEKFKFISPTIFFTILQIILIYLFHDSLIQVILILLFTSIVLFIANLISTFL
ncbi:unnamed protein product [marine sediment metagenome]|uniref:Uncharacterized protein n=1 Tax=marine sediment metagenome TaxID=412755 RepID=X0ZBU6_9ZZZZ